MCGILRILDSVGGGAQLPRDGTELSRACCLNVHAASRVDSRLSGGGPATYICLVPGLDRVRRGPTAVSCSCEDRRTAAEMAPITSGAGPRASPIVCLVRAPRPRSPRRETPRRCLRGRRGPAGAGDVAAGAADPRLRGATSVTERTQAPRSSAECPRSGPLQSRVHRFDSGRRLSAEALQRAASRV
jgi:hypothetical protein